MKTTLLCIFLAAAGSGAFADHIPIPPDGVLEYEARTAVIVQLGSFDLLADLTGEMDKGNLALQYRALTVGGYYRLLKNLKVGAFYRLQAGVWHDDNWVSNAPIVTPGWVWQDTTGQYEHVLMLDASPRFLLDFLPGRSWVLMVKGRFVYDSFENELSTVLRPELTFFWLVDRQPFLDFSAAWEAWLPLNYGSTLIYESYPWLAVNYHVTPELMLQLAGAYRSTVWSTSAQVAGQTADLPNSYQVTYSRWLLSVGVIWTLSP